MGGIEGLGYCDLGLAYDADVVRQVQRGYSKVIDEADLCVDMGGRIRSAVRYVKDPVSLVPELGDLLSAPVRAVVDGRCAGPIRLCCRSERSMAR